MQELKLVVLRLVETLVYLAVGFYVTVTLLQYLFDRFDIQFLGNVWVNWFGVSYLLFACFTLVLAFIYTLIKPHRINCFRRRLSSKIFWFLLLVACYVTAFPFVKGYNPF